MPVGGLVTRNRSTGQMVKFVEPWAFESVAKADEILVFCVSNSHTEVLARDFGAVACVEILRQPVFFDRLKSALPAGATFVAGRVKYDERGEQLETGWRGPDQIAKSKLRAFSYQDEYRFAFSITDALGSGKGRLRLIKREPRRDAAPAEHHKRLLRVGGLRDICRLHEYGAIFASSHDYGAGKSPDLSGSRTFELLE